MCVPSLYNPAITHALWHRISICSLIWFIHGLPFNTLKNTFFFTCNSQQYFSDSFKMWSLQHSPRQILKTIQTHYFQSKTEISGVKNNSWAFFSKKETGWWNCTSCSQLSPSLLECSLPWINSLIVFFSIYCPIWSPDHDSIQLNRYLQNSIIKIPQVYLCNSTSGMKAL